MRRIPGYINLWLWLSILSALLLLSYCSRDKDYINSLRIKMISIPAGSFMMGDSSGQWDEKPVHKVTITQPFYISSTEITTEQFLQFKKDHRFTKGKYAVGISWYNANAFCRWLSVKEGKHYRLPTEAEWEYVCRIKENSGVEDMLDTTLEWCRDWYGPYPAAAVSDPVGMDTGTVKVVRGGLPHIFIKQYTYPDSFYYRPANSSGIAPTFSGFTVPVSHNKTNSTNRELNRSYPGLYGLVFDDLAMKKPLMIFPVPAANSSSRKWVSMNNWSARWQGFIEVPESGDYTFSVLADNKISVQIDGKKLFTGTTNDSLHSGTIHLRSEVRYPVVIQYLHDGGTSFLKLYWQYDKHPRQPVPPGVFTYNGKIRERMEKEYKKGIFTRYLPPSIGFRIVQAGDPASTPATYEPPFVQQCVKQHTTLPAHISGRPYFQRRYLHPVPPDNCTKKEIIASGLHPSLGGHNHHSALVVCPNGDLLAVYFSAVYENDPEVLLMGSRLRYGAEEWDIPTPIMDFPDINDVSPLLWRDGNKINLFWGNIHLKGGYPFQWIVSTDNGATFSQVHFPVITSVADGFSPQPITSVFRDKDGTIYLACDGVGAHSLLWASKDNMKTWSDTGGRTGGRHTAIVPLKDGTFFGVGGKKSDIDGYMPISVSKDKGKTWQIRKSVFPSLGGGQRPALIRLKSGKLLYAGDLQRSDGFQPPGFHQRGAFVALSADEGKTWKIKVLPGTLPSVKEEAAKKVKGGTLGYVSLAQSEDGIIHLITSKNEPALHFSFNEAWILNTLKEDAAQGDIAEKGQFLLDGKVTRYYKNGTKQYETTFILGNKTGTEKYYSSAGTLIWTKHYTGPQTFSWTQYWENGNIRSESHWRHFYCIGLAEHFNRSGKRIGESLFKEGKLLKHKKQN